MAGQTLNTKTKIKCPHGGSVQIVSLNQRVSADSESAALMNDQFIITGCPFTIPPGVPSPCVKVQWLVGDMRVKVNGTPTLSTTSIGLCLSAQQVPQGPAAITKTQKPVQSQ